MTAPTPAETTLTTLRQYIQSILTGYRDSVATNVQTVENHKTTIEGYLSEFESQAQTIRDGTNELAIKANRVDEFDTRITNKADKIHTHSSGEIIDADPLVTAGTIVRRDAAGLFEVASPSVPNNPTPKSYVDSGLADKSNLGHTHLTKDITDRTAVVGGAGAADKLVSTGADGQLVITTEQILTDLHAVNKTYVDTRFEQKANLTHTHTISSVTGLQNALDQKATGEHTHNSNDISNATTLVTGTVANAGLVLKTSSDGQLSVTTSSVTQEHHVPSKGYVDTETAKKANTSHAHTVDAITGLQGALDGKASTTHTHTVSQITDLPTISSAVTNSALVQRTSSGQVTVPAVPGAAEHAVSRGHLDGKLAGKVTGSQQGMELWVGTQAAYDALPVETRTRAGFAAVIY